MEVERWGFSFRKDLERQCLCKYVDKKRTQTVNDTRAFWVEGRAGTNPENLHRLFGKVRGHSSDPARVGRVYWEGWVGHEEEEGPGKTRTCKVLKAI